MVYNAGLSRLVVRVRIPLFPPNMLGYSASGPGDVPFKHVTRVRIPFPVPVFVSDSMKTVKTCGSSSGVGCLAFGRWQQGFDSPTASEVL